jgi:signal transduction histidine kinase
LLLSPVDDAYAVVATHGYAEEQREWMRVVSIPRALLRQTLAALVQADALNLTVPDITTNPLATLARNLGVSAVICMALRQGTEVVGLHVAAACAPHAAFAGQETRIAHGIAQIASLTLQYRRLLEELQGANRLKSDFVATLSHELRSPFNVIIGYGALLLDRVFGDLTPEQAEVIQRIDRSATALLELIDTTLDLSRLENGRLHLDVDEVNLAEILATVDVETREQRAARPRVQFMWHVAAEVPLLRTNGIKLRVILKNLIANAFKFTTAGAVSVDARLEGDGVTVRVRDTGPGIPAEVLPVIFDAFRQAPGTASHLGGVGLGLYIVRQLLTMLGGTVSVESTLGQGTTFSIRLPLEFGARPSSPAA